jgi:hypothetical protein
MKSTFGGWITDAKFIADPQDRFFFLTDYKFWAEHEKELDDWCEKNFCTRQGIVVTALNEYGYTMFMLRWT